MGYGKQIKAFPFGWNPFEWFFFLVLCSYELSGGYRPAPLDLGHIKLTLTQEAIVDKLAENAHNAWAKERIRQGWTYGIHQVGVKKGEDFSNSKFPLEGMERCLNEHRLAAGHW